MVTDQQISLEDLDSYKYTTVANLPRACQTLYQNVAGTNIKVEPPNFPQLAEAIERSIRGPNTVCWQMLKDKKALEPWLPDDELYLRITVGSNLVRDIPLRVCILLATQCLT